MATTILFAAGSAPAADQPTAGLRHGSRANAGDGTLVVYDKINDVFMVPGRTETYWIDNRFYDYQNGVWLTAQAVKGPWELVSLHAVPDKLAKRHKLPATKVTAELPWGVQAVYEPKLRVYRVAGNKGVFLFDGAFYRYDGGLWMMAKRENGPWSASQVRALPQPLRRAVPEPEDGQKVTLPNGDVLVWQASKKIFTADGKPGVVFFDGSFYERRDSKWYVSARANSDFNEVETRQVPSQVRGKDRKNAGKNKDKAAKPAADRAKKDGKAAHEKKAGQAAKAGGKKKGAHDHGSPGATVEEHDEEH